MKFLFYISKKYSLPIVQPIVEYLQNTEHEFAFFLSQKVDREFPTELKKCKYLTDLPSAQKFQPEFVIVPGNFVDFRLPGIKVQIFHGLGVEKPAHYKIRHFFDIYCTSGPLVTAQFKKMQKKYKYFLVKETGWPKVDHIIDFPEQDLKDKYGIPTKKKVILFAPTHSRKMQSAESLISILPDVINPDEVWLIKFHELMDKEIVRSLEKNEQIKLVNDYDITPYLHLADILISDTSSVCYEFMILDKPVITYRTISRKDKGINLEKPDQLRNAIDRSLNNPQEFQKLRIKHLQEVNPKLDGKISEDLIKILIEVYENKELPTNKKPLNLVRKAQILYHEKFKKGYLR